MISIGVVADTHNSLPGEVLNIFANVDEIWHLGDVCDPSTIDPLYESGKPVRVIRGNNDHWPAWPVEMNLGLEGVSFLLVHIPPQRVPHGTDVVIHGHLHVPRDEMIGKTRWLNPGSPSKPRKQKSPSVAILKVDQGKVEWKLATLSE